MNDLLHAHFENVLKHGDTTVVCSMISVIEEYILVGMIPLDQTPDIIKFIEERYAQTMD